MTGDHDNVVNMSKRNLLVCFDAFGTLFKPKKSIAQQYGEIARSLGLVGFTDEQLQVTFKKGGFRYIKDLLSSYRN